MKDFLWMLITFFLTIGASHSEAEISPVKPPPLAQPSEEPGGSLVENLSWDSPFAQKVPESTTSLGNSEVLQMSHLPPFYEATLFRIDAPKITTNRYALKGSMRVFNVPPGGFLDLLTYFEGEDEPHHAVLFLNKFSRTTDWQLFDIRDRNPNDHAKLWRLEIKLVLGDDRRVPATDSTVIQLGSLKLMQYLPTPEAQAPVLPPTNQAAEIVLLRHRYDDCDDSHRWSAFISVPAVEEAAERAGVAADCVD